VYVLVVFYDTGGNPIDSKVVRYRAAIEPGIGVRVKSSVDLSVARLNNPSPGSVDPRGVGPPWKSERGLEFRVLNFEMEQ